MTTSTKTLIANLQGATGATGIAGAGGPAADSAVATYITTPGAATKTAADLAYLNKVQASEGALTTAFTITPTTSGFAPFQALENSFANAGAGAGTYNHGMWFGWNAGRHASGPVTSGKPAMYLGLEDNYFDYAGDLTYGSEFYVGYVSPDGTTNAVADLRPIYFRILDANLNVLNKNVLINMDIGSGTGGYFAIVGSAKSGNVIFEAHQTFIQANKQFNVATKAGTVILALNSPNGPNPADKQISIQFNLGATNQWNIISDNFGEIYFQDAVNSRVQLNIIRGANANSAVVDVEAVLKLGNSQVTTATAGGTGALPATVLGYFQIQDSAGNLRKVPYYV